MLALQMIVYAPEGRATLPFQKGSPPAAARKAPVEQQDVSPAVAEDPPAAHNSTAGTALQ